MKANSENVSTTSTTTITTTTTTINPNIDAAADSKSKIRNNNQNHLPPLWRNELPTVENTGNGPAATVEYNAARNKIKGNSIDEKTDHLI